MHLPRCAPRGALRRGGTIAELAHIGYVVQTELQRAALRALGKRILQQECGGDRHRARLPLRPAPLKSLLQGRVGNNAADKFRVPQSLSSAASAGPGRGTSHRHGRTTTGPWCVVLRPGSRVLLRLVLSCSWYLSRYTRRKILILRIPKKGSQRFEKFPTPFFFEVWEPAGEHRKIVHAPSAQ